MVGDTILIKDISINGNDKLTNTTELSKTLTDNTINALGIDASSRTIWINGQPYGNAYVNINEDTVEAPIGAEIFNDFENNIASGEYSHAEGKGTITNNEAEHASGKYNQSHKDTTLFSIGIGQSKADRKNAIEVTQDGDIYVNSIGGYDGTNPSNSKDIATYLPNMVYITYEDLKALRDNAKLVPGQQYRITDYTCTTSTAGTKSAGNKFDIIVTADSNNKLNEEARAIKHDGDTYFANNNLSAWKLWYCIDNDTNRFAWADSTNGKGVIYRMIDEFDNDCPYDFKNIQFYREQYENTGLYSSISNSTNGTPCYTFSSATPDSTGKFTDTSLSISTNVYSNVIDECINFNIQTLNNNCFFGTYCYCNTFENGCEYNSFGQYCSNNIFGNDCDNNTFGESCSNNIFGNDCDNNSFGNSCSNNIFGNDCDNNTFGNYCSYNTFGNRCQYIKFASDYSDTATKYQYYQYNHFGDGCQRILFIGKETASPSTQVQNYNFSQGINCGNTSYTDVFAKRNLPYETRVLAPGATTQEIR